MNPKSLADQANPKFWSQGQELERKHQRAPWSVGAEWITGPAWYFFNKKSPKTNENLLFILVLCASSETKVEVFSKNRHLQKQNLHSPRHD